MSEQPLLQVHNLKTYFYTEDGVMHFPIPLKQMISVLLLTGAGAPTCVLGAKRMLQLC